MLGNVVILKFAETVSYEETENFKVQVKKLLEEGCRFFAVDMSEVDCITSSGLGVIFTAHKELRKYDGKIVLFGLLPHIAKTIRDWRLDRFIPLFSTQNEACAMLKNYAHSQKDAAALRTS
jgi:anti-anti-sigma factor